VAAIALGGFGSRLVSRLRAVTGEQVFWAVVVAAAVLFAMALMLEPTGFPRGGR